MIYVTGDCHREYRKFNTRNFPEQKKMTKEDYVIVCGDFGGIWSKDQENEEEVYLLDWLNGLPFTLLFVDGNHENFDRLYTYPEVSWHGGRVHKIRPSVLHLMRGQVYEIEGKTFFTFGGASSHDIEAGILEPDDPDFKRKKKQLDREWRLYRINHVSWWKQELPSQEEMEEGRKNLAAHNNQVDVIVTHCGASSNHICLTANTYHRTDILTDYLEEIRESVQFGKWYFGHYHNDVDISEKEVLLYDKIIRVI